MTDYVGQRFGSYRLLRLLGKGGFADVYLGEHVYLKTQAAIKVLQIRLAGENTEFFLKEARTIAHLEHPHIVRVLDFGVEDNLPFLAMNYAPNGTMRQRYPNGTILPLESIVSYVKQIAGALQYAHDEKLIHRDVKPENLLLARNNDILLSDFGIALVAQSTSYQGTQGIVGTVAYMAPEQIQGKSRPASDQYSLGINVYEWLSGRRPFYGVFTELCAQHVFAPPPPLREKVPELSPAVEEVVMKALAKEPQRRFSNVWAFATALEQAAQSASFSILPTIAASSPISAPTTSESPGTPVLTPPNVGSPNTPVPDASTPPPLLTPTLSDPSIPFQPPVRSERRVSRRLVLGGLGLAGLTAVAGGATWWVLSQGQSSHRPANTHLETTLYIYKGHHAYVETLAWSPNGKRIASGSGDKTVQVWDATTGGHAFTYRDHAGEVWAVAWSPDGQRIASGGVDNTVQVWDALTGGHVYTYQGHTAAVTAVAWSPDGQRIASASYDHTVRVWDAANGGHVFIYQNHGDAVTAVAWSPDGTRVASASYDHTVRVWDAANGGHVFIYRGHTKELRAVAWSPDGKLIVSGGYDNTAQVWDALTGVTVYTYAGHSGYINSVVWSPNSKRVASGSGDKTVQVWDASTGKHAFTYRGHAGYVYTVGWSSDGQRIASGASDSTVQVWQAL
jgi:eukaryotic-like serine/threonine-protein kinase